MDDFGHLSYNTVCVREDAWISKSHICMQIFHESLGLFKSESLILSQININLRRQNTLLFNDEISCWQILFLHQVMDYFYDCNFSIVI
jgi:hypothetical protein